MGTCAGCKFFFAQTQNPSECHRYPPRTTVLLLGIDERRQPVIHKNVNYDIVLSSMTCGEWRPKIEVN